MCFLGVMRARAFSSTHCSHPFYVRGSPPLLLIRGCFLPLLHYLLPPFLGRLVVSPVRHVPLRLLVYGVPSILLLSMRASIPLPYSSVFVPGVLVFC